MKLSWEPLDVALVDPFRIAHGTSLRRENVLVRLGEDPGAGLGEAAAVSYLGETRAGIIEWLSGVQGPELDLASVTEAGELARWTRGLPNGSAAARAALDMALHDAWGRARGEPLYRLLGLDPSRIAPTSLTLAMAEPELMAERARSASAAVLKLKLGAPGDEARLAAVRAATQLPLRADANAGWSREEAARMLPLLAQHGVELIEQPLADGDLDGLRALSKLCARPRLFADESIKTARDIESHQGLVEGIVVKLAKCGGIGPALEQIELARSLGLQVMLGCMIETSLAVTAAAHLAPLADYVDLDGPLLISADPFEGISYRDGVISLPEAPGLGVRRRPQGALR
jgi:L-alanine-DL-glutamate epimerase-like enolase superfamily enzyme